MTNEETIDKANKVADTFKATISLLVANDYSRIDLLFESILGDCFNALNDYTNSKISNNA